MVGAVLVMSGCALVVACGSTAATDTSSDGGATDGASKDALAETSLTDVGSPDSATCDLSSDLTKEIPDAALDDSGTRSTGLCLACANQPSTCQSILQECDSNCDCKSIAGGVLTCIAKGGGETTCALMAAGVSMDAQLIGFSLLACVQTNCPDACTPQKPTTDAGTDAGDASDDAGDGS